jgi:hypothetical protein
MINSMSPPLARTVAATDGETARVPPDELAVVVVEGGPGVTVVAPRCAETAAVHVKAKMLAPKLDSFLMRAG